MKVLKMFIAIILLFILVPQKESQALSSKYNVQYVSVVDGDTAYVKLGKKTIKIRMLLIDTPESKDPRKPVQPYAKEAAKYLENYIRYGKLQIQYDNSQKLDKYGRHLVYLYANGKLVNKEMVRYGYARVGYVYTQKYYLNLLKTNESHAKQKHYKIWSIKGYVNPLGEGFIYKEGKASASGSNLVSTPTKPAVKKAPTPSRVGYPTSRYKAGAPKVLANCTAVKKYYPYGITDSHISYQPKFDRDKDRMGCEASGIKYQSWMANN
ncbi:thermonuclease family protein [Macrococcoides bohemicum]|uniref:thermonuclease family protein n=1 Tax=Macrococcoides bohemicum TaxID=1903056 RepID=UPI00165DD2B8|nr:thermonuclease family protein [Macrococcus bohemicus]MBC9873574.1 thermonuclease family protein [Macrococcus bohemicus]